MIKIDYLRVFVCVAQNGSLREAAGALGRTQSALSMTLKQLEDLLGGALFETERKNSLTDLGHYVLDVATDMLSTYDRGVDLIDRYARGRAGRLRIASVPSVAALLLPHLLQGFMEAAERAEIDLIDTDSASVRKSLVAGMADIGLASMSEDVEGITGEFLFRDPLKVVCRADSRLTLMNGPLSWDALREEPLIMNETLQQLPSAAFQRLRTQSTLTVRNVVSLLAMVRSGAGFTILPGLATVELPEGLVTKTLADPDASRTVCMLTPSNRSKNPLTVKMTDHLRRHMPDIIKRYGLLQ